MELPRIAKAPVIFGALLILVGAALPADLLTDAPSDETSPPRLVILNFESGFDDGELGQKVGYSLRAKLRRSGLFQIPDELDFDELESSPDPCPSLSDVAAARGLSAPFEPHFIAWGEVAGPDEYLIRLHALDLSGDGSLVSLERRASGLREVALACRDLADELAKALTGAGYRETYPSMSTEGYAPVGPNLVANGDFELGDASPDHWDAPDGLCSFSDSEDGHGRFVRMDTDVYLSEWQDWRKLFDSGSPASAAPPKTPTSGPKYNTVAGTCGVKLYSDPIPVKSGATYAIHFDARGLSSGTLFFPKVFVKAYGREGPSMELYRMYKAVKPDSPGKWQHFSRIFHPTERTPGVKYMRVILFAYWPPGEYAFDNVEIYEVKKSAESPAPSPRSPTDTPATDAAAGDD